MQLGHTAPRYLLQLKALRWTTPALSEPLARAAEGRSDPRPRALPNLPALPGQVCDPPCLVPGPVTLLGSSRPPGKLFCPWPISRRWLSLPGQWPGRRSPRSPPQGPELLPPTLSARPTVWSRTGVGGDVTGYSGLTTDPARNGQAATQSQTSDACPELKVKYNNNEAVGPTGCFCGRTHRPFYKP